MAALKWSGIAMVALALFLGAVAYRMQAQVSTRAATGASTPVELAHETVVALQAIAAGDELRPTDVGLRGVDLLPPTGFDDPSQVIGRVVSSPLVVGEPLLAKHFIEGSAIARGLAPGERAVAVKVDRVTGLGGFVRPGDRVDVLFFLRRDGREIERTQARTLLRGVRVLAFGKQLERGDQTEPSVDARTAVLAVPEDDAPRLLLADVAGTLRLSLCEPQQTHAGSSTASTSAATDAAHEVTLEALLGSHPQPRRRSRKQGIPIVRGPALEPTP